MSVNVIALVKKETKVDPRTGNKTFHAALSLLDEGGKEYYGTPRYFTGYEEVGILLKREAGATHQQLQDRYPAYERGETVRLHLSLENDETIKHLGFHHEAG